MTNQINNILVDQNNVLLYFTYKTDSNTLSASNDTMPFKFGANTINYSSLFPSNGVSSFVPSEQNETYIPYREESLYTHESKNFIDVIFSNTHSVQKTFIGSQTDNLQEVAPEWMYITPKFSWDTNLRVATNANATATTTDQTVSSIWVSTESEKISKIEINEKDAKQTTSVDIGDKILHIVFGKNQANMYSTSNANLFKHSINHYVQLSNTASSTTGVRQKQYEVKYIEDVKKFNANQDLILLQDGNGVWSAQTYSGNIIKRNIDTLEIENIYSGFDSPQKMIWSEYHKCYFVAGTNNMWKLKDNMVEIIYSIGGYKIIDMDCSPDGSLAMIFRGQNRDVIRIIRNDFFAFENNSYYEFGTVNLVVYCGNNCFYILKESKSEGNKYVADGLIYNLADKTLVPYSISTEIKEKPKENAKYNKDIIVEVTYPKGGETFAIGEKVEIKWNSNKSKKDLVKIDLLSNNSGFLTISDSEENNGSYVWEIPSKTPIGNNYAVKITWLANTTQPSPEEQGTSGTFIISNIKPEPTQEEKLKEDYLQNKKAVAIGYDILTNYVIIVFSNGLVGYHDLNTNKFFGLFDSGVQNITSIGVVNERVKEFDSSEKIRIFVGSAPYLSDKWDSGQIETDLQSIYYGGGNNLLPGMKYYVNLQIYSESQGWSEVQTKEFIMPF